MSATNVGGLPQGRCQGCEDLGRQLAHERQNTHKLEAMVDQAKEYYLGEKEKRRALEKKLRLGGQVRLSRPSHDCTS